MPNLAGTRDYYGKALIDLGHKREDIVVLDADLSCSTRTAKFAAVFPDRFFNAGIAEQNMIGMAAGLANLGKVVFASTFAMFATGRAWEQIRNTLGYPRFNVKIAATHAGITVGEDGASHQALEDITIMRAIPSMNVLVPADAIETYQMIEKVVDIEGPFYIRMSRGNTPLVYENSDYQFEFGKNQIVHEGKDVAIMACGIMVAIALEAAEELKKEGISAAVMNVSTIKPMDPAPVAELARKTGAVVSAEEHSISGGLGGALAELLAVNSPVPMEMVGIPNIYGESGKPQELLEKHQLNAAGIIAKVKKVLKRK